MKQTFRRITLIMMSLFIAIGAFAQVTTSSMSGNIKDDKNQEVVGATVVAVHVPSGTQYYALTDQSGSYRIHNMRIGGPYSVKVTFLGYSDVSREGMVLKLGENFVLDVNLKEEVLILGESVVTAKTKNPILNSEKSGTSINMGSRELTQLPTISRSITDFTRLTPQANGTSFAARDGRMNTITIDGSAFNNNFGLSSNAMPGGSAQPISLDAIEEVSVNIAPYDLRQSQFTGAAINAVTKSGDNKFKVSVYSYLRPNSFTGNKVGDIEVKNARDKNATTYGFRVGGPIIKNKLFFFVSAEYEKENYPSNAWEPSTDGVSNTENKISRTKISDLKTMSDYLKTTYNYDPGKYQDFDNFASMNYKILARIDWNISKNHKFTARYNGVNNTSDVMTNYSSAPSFARTSEGRMSESCIAFQNAFYGFKNTVHSITGELNSIFGSNISNKLLVSYTTVRDTRTSKSTPFPFVDIYEGGKKYMSFGYELYSHNNDVTNNTLSIKDNLTFNLNRHTITTGLSYDQMYFNNVFMQFGTSYYRYDSMNDFMTGKKPSVFSTTYGFDGNLRPGVELSFGMAAAYVQDEWQVNKNLKVTYGLRAELPIYLNKLQGPTKYNGGTKNFEDAVFADGWDDPKVGESGPAYKFDLGNWPKAKIQLSPRVGFNWDVKGDRSIQVRGGSGLFTGLLPFVWFTNQPSSTGTFLTTAQMRAADLPAGFIFNPDFNQQVKNYPALFPQTSGILPRGAELAEVAKDFKMPQVWRSNLAVDVELPLNMVFTLEGIFSKDINAVMQKNVNLPFPQKVPTAGSDLRPYWTTNRINSEFGNAMVLTNTNKGYQGSVTAQLTKNFSYGFSGMLAYTYNNAKEVTTNPGSRASSAWSSNTVASYLNNPELSYSGFAAPHRVVGAVTYKVEYFKHLASTFSLYYSGASQGRSTYAYSNDINGDYNSSDLLYIPKNKDDIKFVDLKVGGVVALTAAQQADIFWRYVEGTPYLSKNKGKVAERFGEVEPWYNRIDFKFLQDVYTNIGKDKYTVQFSIDILNAANLLNSNWGVYKTRGGQSYDRILPLKGMGRNAADGTLNHNLNATSEQNFLDKTQWTNSVSTGSTWGMLFGIRLIF